MSTKEKHDRIRNLIEEFSRSPEFDGIAMAVITEQGNKVYSTFRSGMHRANALVGLNIIIEDLNQNPYGKH